MDIEIFCLRSTYSVLTSHLSMFYHIERSEAAKAYLGVSIDESEIFLEHENGLILVNFAINTVLVLQIGCIREAGIYRTRTSIIRSH